MLNINLDNVQAAGAGGGLPAGGYVLKIVTVEARPDKQDIAMDVDVAEGEYSNYYMGLCERAGFWGLRFFKSFRDRALPFFKQFIEILQASNEGYAWDGNEEKLEGLVFGGIVGLEEYVGNDGSIKTRPRIVDIKTVSDIRDGNFSVPELKKLAGEDKSKDVVSFAEINADDIPF